MPDHPVSRPHGINDEAAPGSDPYTAYDDFNLPA